MTVSSSDNKISYAGNGSTTIFAYGFKIFADSDLLVVLRDALGTETTQILASHYSVTGAGGDSGGNVVMITAPASGETLTIKRELPLTQETDYIEGDDFPADAHEFALDRTVMLVQQQQEVFSRAVVGKVTTDWAAVDLTLPDPVAGKAIGWNADGTALENLSDMSGEAISALGRALIDDTTTADARDTIEAAGKKEAAALAITYGF